MRQDSNHVYYRVFDSLGVGVSVWRSQVQCHIMEWNGAGVQCHIMECYGAGVLDADGYSQANPCETPGKGKMRCNKT